MYFFFLGPVSSFLRGTLRRTEGLSYSAYRSLYHYENMRFYQLGAQRDKGLKKRETPTELGSVEGMVTAPYYFFLLLNFYGLLSCVLPF